MVYCLSDFLNNYRSLLQSTKTGHLKMTAVHSFQTLFAVHMTCDSCVKAVSDSLYQLKGITKVDANLKDQLVSVRGLARMVQVSPTTTLIDLTVRGVTPGTYRATIRSSGDLHDGAASTGGMWTEGKEGGSPKGELGSFTVDKDGKASAFLNHPFHIWEIIGRAMVVSKQDDAAAPLKNDADTLVGVVARSAGMWDNDKTVCSCTGKTLWEERQDEVKKGML
ncbi:hypothetical protein BN1708_005122 [Verticillium longisporum]|uniref:Superoxide dismutase 1 copper chaperone n=1 Tax=Verticillium longisporum TaxID=100787 RepID=A0A0G4M6U6_VERLO|nr:hypothetical protein BN1708_005122 [Verticillium longisporum]